MLLQPATAWGEKAYGLKPTDDYTFFPKDPQKGQKVDLRVSAETLRLLQLQRNIRQDNARAGRKRRWWPRR